MPSPYATGEAWGATVQILFNPDPRLPGEDDAAAAARNDAVIRATVARLYIPGVSTVTIDGRTMDFDGLIASGHRVRGSTAAAGARVTIGVRDYVTDPQDATKVRCIWRITVYNPPESTTPQSVVDVQARGTLDRPASEGGRAVRIEAQSTPVEDDKSDGSD